MNIFAAVEAAHLTLPTIVACAVKLAACGSLSWAVGCLRDASRGGSPSWGRLEYSWARPGMLHPCRGLHLLAFWPNGQGVARGPYMPWILTFSEH